MKRRDTEMLGHLRKKRWYDGAHRREKEECYKGTSEVCYRENEKEEARGLWSELHVTQCKRILK